MPNDNLKNVDPRLIERAADLVQRSQNAAGNATTQSPFAVSCRLGLASRIQATCRRRQSVQS